MLFTLVLELHFNYFLVDLFLQVAERKVSMNYK
jgi:hypothetical protein